MFGAAAYVASQWLAAVAYAAQAAQALGDETASSRYRDIFTQGCTTFETKLWNGEYYACITISAARRATSPRLPD